MLHNIGHSKCLKQSGEAVLTVFKNVKCKKKQKTLAVMVICLGHVSVPLCDVNVIKPTEFTFSSDFLTIGLHLK